MSKGKTFPLCSQEKKIKRMEDSDTVRLQEKKILSLVLHSMEHSCRKEVREDE